MEIVDILIKNASEIITLKGLNRPRIKNEMNNLSIINNGYIAIKDGIIFDIGKNNESNYKSDSIIDAKGKIVTPGFIDPHTHLVFSGSREFELDWKLKGYSYMDILKKGGGILYTVNKTRKAREIDLINQSKYRLQNMLINGTTTCEAKSGYGLRTDIEVKILKTISKLNNIQPIDIIPTFLGAHAVPREYNCDEYVDILVNEMIPKSSKYAKFCDVFCEKGVFTPDQSKDILETGKKYGLTPKIHADEIVDTGGADLSAKIGAISADHLLNSNESGLKNMAKMSVIGVLLPGTPFSLLMNEYADARKIIDLGVPVAIGSDLNPNCWIENMQFIIQLACLNMKMTPAEAICAATFNSACSIGLNDKIGSLEKGKQADVAILNISNHLFLPYHLGINFVDTVIKKGIIVKDVILD